MTVDTTTSNVLASSDLKEDPTAICAAGHALCIGYANGEVQLCEDGKVEAAVPLVSFKMPVRAIQFCEPAKALVAASEDSMAKVVFLSEVPHRAVDLKPGHEGSVKSCAIHPALKFAVTTGCDGFLNVYEIAGDKSGADLVKRELICENKAALVLSSPQQLQAAWSEDGKEIFVAGDMMLRSLSTVTWKLSSFPEIMHKGNISLITVLGSDLVVTAGLDLAVSVWNVKKKQGLCTVTFEDTTKIVQLAYHAPSRYCSILGSSKVGFFQLPVDSLPQSQQQQDTEMKNAEEKPQPAAPAEESKPAAEEEERQPAKKEETRRKLDMIIDAFPQERFQVGATEYLSGLRFLCWNSIGSITLLSKPDAVSISFDFADKSSQRNFVIADTYDISMASMTYSGAILASSTAVQEQGLQTEEDPDKRSVVQFVPFHEWRGLKGWTYSLPKGENAECVAVGTRWAAVYTSQYFVRIFSHEGIQKHIFCVESPVVTMCGYENLLAIVYHHSVPILGNQRLNVRIVDTRGGYEPLLDVPVPLCTDSYLKWIGFSDEGQLFAYDTDGVLRVLLTHAGNTWMPVLDVKAEDAKKDLWLISISKDSVSGIELHGEYAEPKLSDKGQLKTLKLKLPMLKREEEDKNSQQEFEESHLVKSMLVKQEISRKHLWGELKKQRKQQDPEYAQSAGIPTDEELEKAQRDLDIALMDRVRTCCVNGEIEKALSYAEMMQLKKSLSLTATLCQKLHKNDLAEKVEGILEV